METTARFSHTKVDHTKDNTVQFVVSLKAPTLDWVKKRPAICILPVIDLSGSMSGSKLEYAKTSLHKLVDQLTTGDFTGLVGFEDRAHVLVPPGQVTTPFKAKMHEAINKLHTMGGTNLWEGVHQSLEAIAKLDLGPQFLKRAVIFTDGQPTTGITDQDQILKSLQANRRNISVSAFGYGNETNDPWSGCDHDFLGKLAGQGTGNYAYVKDPNDSLTAFGRELGGLLSTYAQDIQVEIEPLQGHAISKAVTDISVEQESLGETSFKISDILSEETRNFVFDATLQKQGKVFPRPVNVFSIKVQYSVLTEDGKREGKTSEIKAKIEFVDPAAVEASQDKELNEVIALAQVVRAQIEAETSAKKGDYQRAQNIMENVAVALDSRGLSNTSRMARAVRDRVGSQQLYASNVGYLRTTYTAGTRAYGMSSMDEGAAVLLADCGVTLSNGSMTSSAQAFTGANVDLKWDKAALDAIDPSLTVVPDESE